MNSDNPFLLNDTRFDYTLFSLSYLKNLRIYIPLLVSLDPDIRIDNYSVIDKTFFIKSGNTKKTNVIISPIQLIFSPLSDFVSNNSLIIRGEYFTKKDIIEYVGYVLEVIHSGAIAKKLTRLSNLKKLTFDVVTGHENQDGVIIFGPTFTSIEAEKKFTPQIYLTLGNKHEFHTLMILEYSNWIVSSLSVQKLYMLAKEYLIKKSSKFKTFSSAHFFSNPKRRFEPLPG